MLRIRNIPLDTLALKAGQHRHLRRCSPESGSSRRSLLGQDGRCRLRLRRCCDCVIRTCSLCTRWSKHVLPRVRIVVCFDLVIDAARSVFCEEAKHGRRPRPAINLSSVKYELAILSAPVVERPIYNGSISRWSALPILSRAL